MAWNLPPAPITPVDDYEVRIGMAADPLGRDLLLDIEREDRLREYGPTDEQTARIALYGDAARTGTVIPLGANRPPIDANEEAA